jgi:TRAP-type C4-dicarboxylate transport system permease small subunit
MEQAGTTQDGSGPASRPDAGARVPVAIEEFLAAAAMALIVLITFANVVVRYFTDESFAFTEEFSVFLMVVLAFTGAAAAFAKNTHIRVTFFVDRLPPRAARRTELAVLAVAIALFLVIAGYGVRLVADDLQYETTSPGIGVPQWLYSVWLPVLAAVVALRIGGRAVRLLRGGA